MDVQTNINVKQNLLEIQNEIAEACKKVNRDPSEITLIAVTKYVTIERANEAIEAGITNIGENRAEGILDKKQNINGDATWHFIGTLQSRKVRDIVNEVDYIHSVDRKSLAKEIHKRANKQVDCFVQVNVSGEESKHGLSTEEVLPFIESLEDYTNVRVVGLMTMAPLGASEAKLREVFKNLRLVREEIRSKQFDFAPCEFLSMGMSNDFTIAIEEGATHIRVGTKLVGSDLKR